MYYVYMHRNKRNGKVYIGITNNADRRWRSNGAEYKPSKSENANRPFHNAIQKHGFDTFEHIILETAVSFEFACRYEMYYISFFDSTNPKNGYNVSKGGNGGRVYKVHPRNMLGKAQTEYQKANQRKIMSVPDNNPMKNGSVVWGETHSHPKGMTGKKHTDEKKRQISETAKRKNINCKAVEATFPNGDVKTYRSTGEAATEIGLSKPVVLKLIRLGRPFKIKIINQYSQKVAHLEGLTVKYLDNTEVTG